jgi:hypothetical protein
MQDTFGTGLQLVCAAKIRGQSKADGEGKEQDESDGIHVGYGQGIRYDGADEQKQHAEDGIAGAGGQPQLAEGGGARCFRCLFGWFGGTFIHEDILSQKKIYLYIIDHSKADCKYNLLIFLYM